MIKKLILIYREATVNDIGNISSVRMSVKENVLNNPSLITQDDYVNYLTKDGKGWVCEVEDRIVGFSIVGLTQHNVWALFVHPEFEGKGIGRLLHDMMINWYFNQTNETIWLGTEQNTKAESFYKHCGWTPVGLHATNEIKFEMTFEAWKRK